MDSYLLPLQQLNQQPDTFAPLKIGVKDGLVSLKRAALDGHRVAMAEVRLASFRILVELFHIVDDTLDHNIRHDGWLMVKADHTVGTGDIG